MKEAKKITPNFLRVNHPHNLALKLIDFRIKDLLDAHQNLVTVKNRNRNLDCETDMKVITTQLIELERTKSLLINLIL